MRRLNKINKKLLIILILFISIGFAYLTRDLSLSGISSIFRNTWDIHFENVQVKSGSVEANTPVIDVDETSVSFYAELNEPGDYYEFTIDAVNEGTIDAMIDTFSSIEIDEEIAPLVEYTITYEDGEALAQYQELNAGDSCVYKIRLYYKLDIQEDDLPDEAISLDLTFTVDYIQADSNRIRRRAENTLYNVLKNEAESGGLAKKYTGAHQDSMDASLSTKDIYHWYATNDTDGTAVTNKNNVIFANHCWQLIRTTDTGGAKLIYNGEVENNQCQNTRGKHPGYVSVIPQTISSTYYYGTNYIYDKENNNFSLSGNVTTGTIETGQYTCKSTSQSATCTTLYYVDSLKNGSTYYLISLNSNSHFSQFGTIYFNKDDSSLADFGYMYNIAYRAQNKSTTENENVLKSNSASTSYWYADSIQWAGYEYRLGSPYQINSENDYINLVGKYSFFQDSQNYASLSVYYIVAVDETSIYYIELDDSGNHNLSSFNYTYTYGESYIDNGNGTYTINNPTTINRTDWYTNYSNLQAGEYICKNATNNTCSELLFVISATNKGIDYIKVSDVYKYSKRFNWDGSKYVLNNDMSVSFWNLSNTTNINSLNNAHYTCWNASGECTTLSYIYSYYSSFTSTLSYINLTNGKSITDAINEMIYNDNVNAKNSTIKTGIDKWYEKYLLNYSDYLEDTIYCNDRSQRNQETNGWNPDGGSLSTKMVFFGSNDLSCPNETDRFSTINNKAKLDYKVGLMSYREMNLLGNNRIRKSGQNYWLISPVDFLRFTASGRYVSDIGNILDDDLYYPYGLRPAISLKTGTTYSSGNGSMANPYVVSTN